MARTEIAINEIPYQGILVETTTAGDATNGMQMSNDGNTLLKCENGGGGAVELTIQSVNDPFGRSEDIVQSVGAGETYFSGPFIPSIWNQPGAKLFVDLDSDVSVTLTAIRYNPRR